MRAYDQYRMFEGMVESRTIASGRVAEFPITGTMALKPAWGAGEELVGNATTASKTIGVQLDARPIATHFEVDNIDLMITQWEYRSELARQAGQTMANARDLQVGAFIARAGLETLVDEDPRLFVAGNAAAGGTGWRNTLKDGPIYGTNFSAALANLGTSTDPTERLTRARAPLRWRTSATCGRSTPRPRASTALSPRSSRTSVPWVWLVTPATSPVVNRYFFGGVADAGGLGAGLRQGMNGLGDRLGYMGVTIVKTTSPNDARTDVDQIDEARYNLNFSSTGADVRPHLAVGCIA